MSDYFNFSQQVKEEILRDNDLMNIIENHMGQKEYAKIIGVGTQNTIYRIGKLEGGLWVALRQKKNAEDIGVSLPYLKLYETYAIRAESYANEGKRVTKFCVGIVKEYNAALLIEDLTEGGRRKIVHDDSVLSITGYFEDSPDEDIYLDLDNDSKVFEELRFMSKEARINLF